MKNKTGRNFLEKKAAWRNGLIVGNF